MFAVFPAARKTAMRLLGVLALVTLAACDTVPGANTGGPSIDAGAPVTVALLVPRGSGQSGDALLAQNLENAARLAITDLQGAQIDLQVYDTAGNAQVAAAKAVEAADAGAQIILGPLYAEAANAVGVAVANRNINVLAFSNNTTIAGGNVFVLGQTFDTAAQRLTSYAARQGKGSMVVVHGTDLSGELGKSAIQRAIAGTPANLVGSVPYDLSQQSVIATVPQVRDAVTNGGANSIFLTATTAGALPLFTQLLPEAGLTPETTQYIGLTRWDIPPQTLELPGVQGGWFALPDPAKAQLFRSRYQAAYGSSPHPIAGLGYDGIAAIGALVASGNSNALTGAALTQSAGFQGVGGIFRLLPNGTNQRGLAVATIQNKQVVVIDPAPTSFSGAGL